MNILHKIILSSLFLIEFSLFATAQTTKQIEIDGNEPYVDHISLTEGSTDMDLLVKFTFDEPNNTLIVNLIKSYSYSKTTHVTHMLFGALNFAQISSLML